jgi:hypothetical protein
MPLWRYLQAHPRLSVTALALACLLLGLLFGRASVHESVRIETRTVEVEKRVEVEVEKRVYVQAKASSGGVTIRRVIEKSTCAGGSKETTTEDIREGHESHEDVHAEATRQTERIVYLDRTVEKVVQRTSEKPQWRLSALAGVSVPVVLHGGFEGRWWVAGAAAERRVVGPLWLGLWGLSSGQGGVKASWEW